MGRGRRGDHRRASSPQLSDERARASASCSVRVFARTTAEQKLRIVQRLQGARARRGDDRRRRERRARARARRTSASPWAAAAPTSRARPPTSCSPTTTSPPSSRRCAKGAPSTATSRSSSSSCSRRTWASLVAVFVVSFFAGWPPLTPLQILWINLVTNGLPALALGVDPPDPGTHAGAAARTGRGPPRLRRLPRGRIRRGRDGAAATSLYCIRRPPPTATSVRTRDGLLAARAVAAVPRV